MIIGSSSEDKGLEKRISITPDIIKKYISQGFKVLIEKDYGAHLGFSNDTYIKEGCEIENKENVFKKSDIILQLNLPDEKNWICQRRSYYGKENFYYTRDCKKIHRFEFFYFS